MASKFVVLALLVAAAQASGIHGGASSFSYGVADPHTGDFKNQHETRVGGNVVGQYSLLESDGTRRVVDYAANPHSGFNAVVRREGHAVHPAPVAYAHAAPVAVAAAPVAVAAHGAGLGYGAGLGLGAGLGYGAGLGLGAGLGYSAGLGYGAHAGPAVSAYTTSVHGIGNGYGAHGGYGALGYGRW